MRSGGVATSEVTPQRTILLQQRQGLVDAHIAKQRARVSNSTGMWSRTPTYTYYKFKACWMPISPNNAHMSRFIPVCGHSHQHTIHTFMIVFYVLRWSIIFVFIICCLRTCAGDDDEEDDDEDDEYSQALAELNEKLVLLSKLEV